MDLSKEVHNILSKKPDEFLKRNSIHYIADISEMPSLITRLFAGPKMREYNFPIIWAQDEYFKFYYPKEDGKLTIIEIDDQFRIKKIYFEGAEFFEISPKR